MNVSCVVPISDVDPHFNVLQQSKPRLTVLKRMRTKRFPLRIDVVQFEHGFLRQSLQVQD